MILFHGTNADAAIQIKNKVFIASECSDFGKAVYFSDLEEWAKDYGNVIIKCCFNGIVLDLSNERHFKLYRNIPSGKDQVKQILVLGYEAIKDNHIIAVYNKNKITITNN